MEASYEVSRDTSKMPEHVSVGPGMMLVYGGLSNTGTKYSTGERRTHANSGRLLDELREVLIGYRDLPYSICKMPERVC
jgi:hypothetical protein